MLVCQLVIMTVKASDYYHIKISIPLFELNIMRFIWQLSGKVFSENTNHLVISQFSDFSCLILVLVLNSKMGFNDGPRFGTL